MANACGFFLAARHFRRCLQQKVTYLCWEALRKWHEPVPEWEGVLQLTWNCVMCAPGGLPNSFSRLKYRTGTVPVQHRTVVTNYRYKFKMLKFNLNLFLFTTLCLQQNIGLFSLINNSWIYIFFQVIPNTDGALCWIGPNDANPNPPHFFSNGEFQGNKIHCCRAVAGGG